MKKLFLLFFLALALMMAGCTKVPNPEIIYRDKIILQDKIVYRDRCSSEEKSYQFRCGQAFQYGRIQATLHHNKCNQLTATGKICDFENREQKENCFRQCEEGFLDQSRN